MPFSPDDYTPDALATQSTLTRLEKQYERLRGAGLETTQIESAVDAALANVFETDVASFVVYGEPQSGKTEMMTALTAGLLDGGKKLIIVLTNDSVQLMGQNLSRFAESGLSPAPKSFSEILEPKVVLQGREWIIFAKKNGKDLQKLLDKVKSIPERVIIDDEADFASPNGKINSASKSSINKLIESLIGENGIYIGVTATPARLDLNLTFQNDNTQWVDFPAHSHYTGQDTFFPVSEDQQQHLAYRLTLLPDQQDSTKFIRAALLAFIVNAAYLNMSNLRPGNYSMLVHTSGKKLDHSNDYDVINNVFTTLSDHSHVKYNDFAQEAYMLAEERYGEDVATKVLQFALKNIAQYNIVVMNSDGKQEIWERATSPTTMFTVAIGGNIVSRGVTFNNLLLMFFTRDARHQIQQDTYIQRARMFGARGAYLEWFELHIPDSLYRDWQRCFVFHKLSLQRLREGLGAPTWIQDSRIKPAAAASISRAGVDWASGEMFWDLFDFTPDIESATTASKEGMEALEQLQALIGATMLPDYLLEFIRNFRPHGDASVVVHRSVVLSERYKTANLDDITRDKGLMGANQLERAAYPEAVHHLMIFANPSGKARLYYKYSPNPADIKVRSKNLTFVARTAS